MGRYNENVVVVFFEENGYEKICCFVVCMCLLFGMSLQVEAKGISSLNDEVVDDVSDKGLINEVTYKINISKDAHEEQYYATVPTKTSSATLSVCTSFLD